MAPAILDGSSMDDLTSDGRLASTETNNACVDRLTLLRAMPEAPTQCNVCVVGAGPAGLMLASNLARMGINVQVVDDRADQTPVGRYVMIERP